MRRSCRLVAVATISEHSRKCTFSTSPFSRSMYEMWYHGFFSVVYVRPHFSLIQCESYNELGFLIITHWAAKLCSHLVINWRNNLISLFTVQESPLFLVPLFEFGPLLVCWSNQWRTLIWSASVCHQMNKWGFKCCKIQLFSLIKIRKRL